ncbi:hypothetical protein HYC85_014525 [Camellia sinensis]|uniref:Uncharacterized protein n=1 Tax=Camellia sinensis TaxID=4442 RepID=A0A7J7H9U8_CAMSI|nr:hypothetical protein HYC85_014525 [Camellia sinensis]
MIIFACAKRNSDTDNKNQKKRRDAPIDCGDCSFCFDGGSGDGGHGHGDGGGHGHSGGGCDGSGGGNCDGGSC